MDTHDSTWSALGFLQSPAVLSDAFRAIELLPPGTPKRAQLIMQFMVNRHGSSCSTLDHEAEWTRFLVSDYTGVPTLHNYQTGSLSQAVAITTAASNWHKGALPTAEHTGGKSVTR
jgi:hypothetical protein